MTPTHNFNATFQEGIVSQVDDKTHRIKATIPALEDFETAWLPYLTPCAGGNQFYSLPDVGELVAILLDARGEGGCVLGAIYNAEDPTPATSREVWMRKFSNGTVIAHNRNTGDVTVKTTGKVIVRAGQVEINAPTTINGNVQVNGNLQASGEISAPTVSASGVSLATHKHTGNEGRPTSPPN